MSPHYDFHLLNLLSDKYVQILYPFFTVLTIFLWLSLGSSLYILPTVFCLFFKSKKQVIFSKCFMPDYGFCFHCLHNVFLKKKPPEMNKTCFLNLHKGKHQKWIKHVGPAWWYGIMVFLACTLILLCQEETLLWFVTYSRMYVFILLCALYLD